MKSRGLGWAHRGIASCHLRRIHIVSTVTPSKARGRCRKHSGFKDREGKGVTLTCLLLQPSSASAIDSCPVLQSENEGKTQGLLGSQSGIGGWRSQPWNHTA